MNVQTSPAVLPSMPISSLPTAATSITSFPVGKPKPFIVPPRCGASKISANIFISDARTACSPAALRSLGITHVISILGPSILRFRPKFPDWVTCLDLPLDDSPFEDLTSAVRKATAWMEEVLGGCEAKRKIGGKCRCFLQDDNDQKDNDEQSSIGASTPRSRILVHCWQGVSRSPSIVAAYYIKAHCSSSSHAYTHTSGITAEKAIDFIRSRRPCVNPNQGFIRQLRQYEAIVKAECDMEDEWSTK